MTLNAHVTVIDGNIEGALKYLKKALLKDGLFKELKVRQSYMKPSQRRKVKSAVARKKLKKAAKKRAEGIELKLSYAAKGAA
jgi:small subunit ribosomal protein S21